LEINRFSGLHVNGLGIRPKQKHVVVVENVIARCKVNSKVGAVADYKVWTVIYIEFPIGACRSPQTPLAIHNYSAQIWFRFVLRRCGARSQFVTGSLDEYYLTRTEMRILREEAVEICALIGPECRLVELGSGSNAKTRILLDHLPAPAAYVPVDIALEQFKKCSARIADLYPELCVTPVYADFTTAFTLPEMPFPVQRTVAFFPGSTIGNLEPAEAENFFHQISLLCGAEGAQEWAGLFSSPLRKH
jgi:Histidine-specific methyltransferase, SAM-dependent